PVVEPRSAARRLPAPEAAREEPQSSATSGPARRVHHLTIPIQRGLVHQTPGPPLGRRSTTRSNRADLLSSADALTAILGNHDVSELRGGGGVSCPVQEDG